MSRCTNISTKTVNKANPDLSQELKHIESEQALTRDKKNSFNYNLKKCRTLSESEYRHLMLSKKKQLSISSIDRGNSTSAERYQIPIVKESDIILEEKEHKPR
jgi:hypothetical protein